MPLRAHELNHVDLYVMLALTILIFPILWWRRTVTRLEGGFLLAGYVAYVVYLGMRSGL